MRSLRPSAVAVWGRVVLLAAWCAIGGCGGSLKGRMAAVIDARSSGFGAWALVRFYDHPRSPDLQGEIIAAGKDSLMLLTSDGLVVLSMTRLIPAFAELHEVDRTHEILLELPAVKIESPGGRWETLAHYARFPQGMPAEVDRAALRLPRAPIPPPSNAVYFAGARSVMVSDFSAERAILRYSGDAKDLGHEMAIMLRDKLRDNLRVSGVTAEVGDIRGSSDLVVEGRFILVDEGSAAARAPVGTGEATLAVRVIVKTPAGQNLADLDASRSSTGRPLGREGVSEVDSRAIIHSLMSAIAKDVAEQIGRKMKP